MQYTLSKPPSPTEFNSNPSFNVVIAYEDFETGKHAKKTYDFLVENLDRDCQFNNQMWKFDVLGIEKLRQIAGADAAAADIVVVSCHGDELPEPVKTWMESWLAESDKPLALVALFDRSREEAHKTCAARNYLAEIARRGNMEFFAEPDEWPGSTKQSEAFGFEARGNFNQRALSTLAGVAQREVSPPSWSPKSERLGS